MLKIARTMLDALDEVRRQTCLDDSRPSQNSAAVSPRFGCVACGPRACLCLPCPSPAPAPPPSSHTHAHTQTRSMRTRVSSRARAQFEGFGPPRPHRAGRRAGGLRPLGPPPGLRAKGCPSLRGLEVSKRGRDKPIIIKLGGRFGEGDRDRMAESAVGCAYAPACARSGALPHTGPRFPRRGASGAEGPAGRPARQR